MFEVLLPEFYRDLFSVNRINGRMFLSLTAADFDSEFLGSMATYEHPLSNELNLNRFITKMARLPRILAPYDDDLQRCLRIPVESKSVHFLHISDDSFWVDMIIKNLHKLSEQERHNFNFDISRTFIGQNVGTSRESTETFLKSSTEQLAGAGHIVVVLTVPALRCKQLQQLLLSWTQFPRAVDVNNTRDPNYEGYFNRQHNDELLFSSNSRYSTTPPIRNIWLLLLEDISLERFPPILLALLKDQPTINFVNDTFESGVVLLRNAIHMANSCLVQEVNSNLFSYEQETIKEMLERVEPLGLILTRPNCLRQKTHEKRDKEFRVFVSASRNQKSILLKLRKFLANSKIEMVSSFRLELDESRDEKRGLFLQTLNRLHSQSSNIAQTMLSSRIVLVLMDNEHLLSRDLLHCLCLATKYRKPIMPIRTCRTDIYRLLQQVPAQGRLLLSQALTEELIDLSSQKWFAKEAVKLTQKLKR
ncbi:hypothetical protein Ciccas_009400 [Cichlidogyrus casuarinus]|uniref:Uncharacterized protein n=1 Tax=Cichlidogyrus casuarinus TaxID=1844966 RepID=A0ABD2PX57_9PLAT